MRRKRRWSYFLLRNTGADLQKMLRETAEREHLPLAEVVRGALCEHYELDCRPIRGQIRLDAWGSTDTILCRFQTELFQAIKKDAAETGESMRGLILAALEAHYLTREAA